jgi:hypothetical protein
MTGRRCQLYLLQSNGAEFRVYRVSEKVGTQEAEDNWRLSNKIPTEIEFNNEALLKMIALTETVLL